MTLKVVPAGKEDAGRSIAIEARAYGPNPHSQYLFPGSDDNTGEDSRVDNLIRNLDSPFCRWMQVVDEDLASQGKESRIAFSEWYVWDNPPPKEEHDQPAALWGPGTNPEACRLFFDGMRAKWHARLGGKPHVYLKLLHTDPDHQKRGAGSMLLQWGSEEADRLGIPSYLEASEEGLALYKKHGYETVEVHHVDFSKWGGPEDVQSCLMLRQPKSKNT